MTIPRDNPTGQVQEDHIADWKRYFNDHGKSEEKATRLSRRLAKHPFNPEKYERQRKIGFALVVLGILILAVFIAYVVLTLPETILSVRDTVRNDEFRGFPFTLEKTKITGDGRLVNVRLTLDDSRGYVMWYFFVCNTPNCVMIQSGSRANDSFTLGDGTALELANQTSSSTLSWTFLALYKGTDRHFYFMFVQTVDFVRETGFSLEIEIS